MSRPTLAWLRELFGPRDSTDTNDSAPLKVSIDTRTLEVGDTFWALHGARDGHDFVQHALSSGARAAVVTRKFPELEPAMQRKLIRVDDTMKALTLAATKWRAAIKSSVLGITGSVGKTTTKDFVRAALSEQKTVGATVGNFNNEIGVPLTLLSTDSLTDVLVCEMGAARTGDIDHLCKIAKPDSGIITSIAFAHLESFDSIENVQSAKGELFRYVAEQGTAFVPLNDARCVAASGVCKHRIGYGFEPRGSNWESDYVQGEDLQFDDSGQARFVVQGEPVSLGVPGRPAAQAALAAMSVAMHHGLTASTAARGVARAVPTAGRASLHKFGSLTVLDDSYNANPSSMRSALETLSLRQAARRVAILGDMLELGEFSDEAHREIIGELDRAGVAVAVLVGPRFSHVAASSFTRARLLIYPSVEEALPSLPQLIAPNDLVLVKASRGMALDRAVKKLEEHYS
ncbi:MAG: UDP-N-acetylmuramoyl-tripeptide--D-alanyl-D-alanine ligase [Calditrichaeota bacterium]|nr:UDP-N-acetylmuramoyl-tripeptide--D-alanyl-D-alanine ligase [Calditrichota bacterium]